MARCSAAVAITHIMMTARATATTVPRSLHSTTTNFTQSTVSVHDKI